MKSSTGRWVSGEDFFDRERELEILEAHIRDRNHMLLTGQRRIGKTSVLRELGRRLEADGWILVFTDVESATCPEDAIAEMAGAIHEARSIAKRFAAGMKRWVSESLEEVSAYEFRVKIRGEIDAWSWRVHGEKLLRECKNHDLPILLVIDELPIFLYRMLNRDRDSKNIEEFLSWLRGVIQSLGRDAPVLVLSGSIGLEPLVRRLGIPDRINHLYPFRLDPWDKGTSIACFRRLAATYGIHCDNGVAEAAYNMLGIGIPHHVQSFFARVRDFATMQGSDRITVEDIGTVYRTALLGPSGQTDLAHYETRLKMGLDDANYTIAMEILAEAAVRHVFTTRAGRALRRSTPGSSMMPASASWTPWRCLFTTDISNAVKTDTDFCRAC